MNCLRCKAQVIVTAPFCPVCGADPTIGADWLATSHLVVDASGRVVVPEVGDLEDLTSYGRVAQLIYEATQIAAAEAASAEAIMRREQAAAFGEPHRDPAEVERAEQRRDEAFKQATGKAATTLAACLPRFRHIAETIRSAVDAGPTAGVFARKYSRVAWVCDEYGAYLAELADDELRDVLRRRTLTLLSRLGYGGATTFSAPDGSFGLVYDGLALAPLPAEAVEVREELSEAFGGYDGSFGELALALVPAAWRGWYDLALAPWAGLLVFVRPDPLDGIACDDEDWRGERAGLCEHYGRWLRRENWRVDDVKPAAICGLPAVRSRIFELDDHGPHPTIDIAWVRGSRHLFTIAAFAPDQREDLARAVYGPLPVSHRRAARPPVTPARRRSRPPRAAHAFRLCHTPKAALRGRGS